MYRLLLVFVQASSEVGVDLITAECWFASEAVLIVRAFDASPLASVARRWRVTYAGGAYAQELPIRQLERLGYRSLEPADD